MKKIIEKKEFILTVFIVLAVLTRLLPHLPNFTPLTAIALFGGHYFNNRKLGYGLPLLIMFLSDLFIGFYSISVFVYAAFVVVCTIGVFSKKIGIKSILLGSLTFFIISNFGVWIIGYPKTISGLVECYYMALPFFRYSLLGDFTYGISMIYGYRFIEKHYMSVA